RFSLASFAFPPRSSRLCVKVPFLLLPSGKGISTQRREEREGSQRMGKGDETRRHEEANSRPATTCRPRVFLCVPSRSLRLCVKTAFPPLAVGCGVAAPGQSRVSSSDARNSFR